MLNNRLHQLANNRLIALTITIHVSCFLNNTNHAVPPTPAPVPVPGGKRATGMWDFNASAPHELSFKAGEVLIVHDDSTAWWKGTHKLSLE